jgi:hypothetical protein
MFKFTGIAEEITWQPTDIGGCKIWLRSDLGITKDPSDRVSIYADQSGNGNDFTQATDAAKPVWRSAYFNGQDALQFDGANNTMVKTGGITIAQPFSVFMVFADININLTSAHTLMRNSPLGSLVDVLNGEIRLYAGVSLASGTVDFVHNGDYIVEAQFNGANSKGFVNNVQKVSGDAGTNTLDANDLYVGSYGTGGFMALHLLEDIIYSPSPSAPDRTLLYNYFNTRYGL